MTLRTRSSEWRSFAKKSGKGMLHLVTAFGALADKARFGALAAVRRLALSLSRQERSNKRGVKHKRLHCALDPSYLPTVLDNAKF